MSEPAEGDARLRPQDRCVVCVCLCVSVSVCVSRADAGAGCADGGPADCRPLIAV